MHPKDETSISVTRWVAVPAVLIALWLLQRASAYSSPGVYVVLAAVLITALLGYLLLRGLSLKTSREAATTYAAALLDRVRTSGSRTPTLLYLRPYNLVGRAAVWSMDRVPDERRSFELELQLALKDAYRVICLDLDDHVAARSGVMAASPGWGPTVTALMQAVPVIVVGVPGCTPAFATEVHRILGAPDLLAKTVFAHISPFGTQRDGWRGLRAAMSRAGVILSPTDHLRLTSVHGSADFALAQSLQTALSAVVPTATALRARPQAASALIASGS